MKPPLLLLALLMITAPAAAQLPIWPILAEYMFHGNDGCPTTDDAPALVLEYSRLYAFTAFSRSDSLECAGAEGVFNSTDWPVGGEGLDENHYAGFTFELACFCYYYFDGEGPDLRFQVRRSELGPTEGEVRYLYGGMERTAATWSLEDTEPETVEGELKELEGVEPVEFRFYAWGAKLSESGQNLGMLRFDDVEVSFSLASQIAAEREPGVPDRFALHAAYPNPFNPETVIGFDVAQAGPVRLVVYDLLGREVAVLEDGEFGPGKYTARWEAGGAPSGVYLVRMEAAGQRHAQRVVVAR